MILNGNNVNIIQRIAVNVATLERSTASSMGLTHASVTMYEMPYKQNLRASYRQN
jgi:hypothetical protein